MHTRESILISLKSAQATLADIQAHPLADEPWAAEMAEGDVYNYLRELQEHDAYHAARRTA
jgi:hypothetical protein